MSLPVLLMLSGGGLYLVLAGMFPAEPAYTVCLFRNVTGLPCPSCGMGRGLSLLAHGFPAEAMEMNLLSVPVALALLASVGWTLRDVLLWKDSFVPFLRKKAGRGVLWPVLGLALLSWIYNLYHR
jgi:hypothetical protein